MVEKHDRAVRHWRGDVAMCNADWPTRRIVETPGGFLCDFGHLVDALRIAVEFEEERLLAPIAQAA